MRFPGPGAVRVVEDPGMVVPGEPVVVTRGWRDRLFGRPWRPFKRTEIHTPMVPDRAVIVWRGGPHGPRTLIAHPAVAAELYRAAREPG